MPWKTWRAMSWPYSDACGLTRADLVGMSFGGLIAQMIAVAHPDRVGALTLIASEPLGWDGAPLPHISDAVLVQVGRLAGLDWSDAGRATDCLLDLERSMTGAGTRFDVAARRAGKAQVLARTGSITSSFNHADLSLRDDWSGRFREIGVPTLVIHGDEDPVLPVANGRALAGGIDAARLFVTPGVGREIPGVRIPGQAKRSPRRFSVRRAV